MPDFTMRAIVVVDAADQAAANAFMKLGYDSAGGEHTFTAALRTQGGDSVVAYWAELSIGAGDLEHVHNLADDFPKSEIWIWVDQPRGVMQRLQGRFGGNEYKDPNRETRTKARVRISASRADSLVALNQLGYEVPNEGA